ncbi:MAG: type 4a pilus biogenesis protein PilO [Chitinispirillaceae bacterium]|nr:type 4a pilus biogenesis protein PilO [Chitinispirillaceae bacterium]
MKKIKFDIKDPRLRVPLLVILLTGGGVYYWYTQMLTPVLKERTELRKQLVAKQDTLRIIQALKPQLAQLREELLAAQHRLDSLKSIFPDSKEIPKLIRELTSVGRASGIMTTKFNPMPDVEREYFVENHYSIMVEGGYHELADFFAFLANFTLIINLSAMNVAANPGYNETTTGDHGGFEMATVVANFEMTTFSSKR